MSRLLDGLNPAQRKAVKHTDGPLLIIAGPGSGKTRTVVHSIAYAIENFGVAPDEIVAFTFTNKAVDELKDRLSEILRSEITKDIWISTFHSFCGHVSNTDFDKLGIDNTPEFTVDELTHIYQERAHSQIDYIQHHEFVDAEEIHNFISKCEMENISPETASNQAPHHQSSQLYVEIYKRYKQISENGTDNYTKVQLYANALFRDRPEVKVKWQEKFELIFVDEYQDTDPVQYQIIKALAEKHQNLRVVGDDDQGIYGWRGADIQNILNFEKDYPNAKVIPLGQNYRSTQKIVEVSRALTDFNPDRRDKELFTRNLEGPTVKYLHCEDHEEEASVISDFIYHAIQEGRNPSDFAVLYRTNRQADTFEDAFKNLEIPYYNVNKSENRNSEQPEHAVSLMTIHRSKGLEFSNVFIVGICQELLPHYYNCNEKDWDEEIRLLYVAMTRAKNWLCLSSYEKEGDNLRGQSPFIERGFIPINLLESIDTLKHIPTPPAPEEMKVSQEQSDSVESLPEKLLETDAIVLGIDPGVKNIGWSITQKLSDGYTVLDCNTQTTQGWGETLNKTAEIINKLIASYSIDAIAIERLEGARDDWFRYVAACVAEIQQIARYHRITEVCLYTPQQLKYAATGNRKADKTQVMQGVKERCNLLTVPNSDHAADAIAASLCYLRNYLNSSRFEGNKRKRDRYQASYYYLNKNQYEAAVNEFKHTINIDPIYTEAHSGLGRAYLAQGNLEAAENAAKRSLKLTNNNHPDTQKLLSAIGHYRFGCSSLKNSDWNIAIDKFKEAINREPIFADAYCGLSQAYLKIDNLEAAKNAADEALNLRTDYPPARELLNNVKMKSYYKGKTYFNREEYDKAIIELQRAVTIDQDFKGAYLHLGKTYLKLGDLEAAEKEAREALQVDSTYELASKLLSEIKEKHKEQGDDYRKKESYAEAVKSYQQAIRIDDKYRNAYNSLGITYYNMKDYNKAISAYQQAINVGDSSHVVHTNLSIVYLEISVYVKAVNSLKRAISIKPDYQMAHYYLARAYFNMENLPDASKTVLEAKRLEPNDQRTLKLVMNIQDAYLNRGHDYFNNDNLGAAEDEARAALHLDQNYESANRLLTSIKEKYVKLGLKSLKQNEYKEAVKFAKEALRIDENYKPASELLRKAYYEQGVDHIEKGRYDKGINILSEANDISQKCEKTYYYLGLAYFKLNRLKKAQLSVNKALKIQPNYPQASELLSDINHPRNWLRLGVANVRHFTRRILNLNQD